MQYEMGLAGTSLFVLKTKNINSNKKKKTPAYTVYF